MNYCHALILYQTVTPLHVGCGQDVGVVDLPVIRERTTGYPFLPGSGTRGALRALLASGAVQGAEAKELFGPLTEDLEDEGAGRYAGSVAVHDAKLLLFPVRSDRGLYLWITCPAAVERFEREVEVFLGADLADRWRLEVERGSVGEDRFLGAADLGTDPAGDGLHLEEYRYRPPEGAAPVLSAERESLKTWAGTIGSALGRSELGSSTVLVSNRSFFHFANHATLLLQHNRLDATKTVAEGQLFSLEAVPPEAVFFGFLGATDARWQAARDGAREDDAGADTEGRAESAEREGSGSSPGGRLGAQQVLERVRDAYFPRQATTGLKPLHLHLGGHESTGLGVTRLAWIEAKAASGDGDES